MFNKKKTERIDEIIISRKTHIKFGHSPAYCFSANSDTLDLRVTHSCHCFCDLLCVASDQLHSRPFDDAKIWDTERQYSHMWEYESQQPMGQSIDQWEGKPTDKCSFIFPSRRMIPTSNVLRGHCVAQSRAVEQSVAFSAAIQQHIWFQTFCLSQKCLFFFPCSSSFWLHALKSSHTWFLYFILQPHVISDFWVIGD